MRTERFCGSLDQKPQTHTLAFVRAELKDLRFASVDQRQQPILALSLGPSRATNVDMTKSVVRPVPFGCLSVCLSLDFSGAMTLGGLRRFVPSFFV